MDDDALGVELVGEVYGDGVSGSGPDGGARELAVDAHHHVLHAIGCPVHVLHIEVVASVLRYGKSCPNQN